MAADVKSPGGWSPAEGISTARMWTATCSQDPMASLSSHDGAFVLQPPDTRPRLGEMTSTSGDPKALKEEEPR